MSRLHEPVAPAGISGSVAAAGITDTVTAVWMIESSWTSPGQHQGHSQEVARHRSLHGPGWRSSSQYACTNPFGLLGKSKRRPKHTPQTSSYAIQGWGTKETSLSWEKRQGNGILHLWNGREEEETTTAEIGQKCRANVEPCEKRNGERATGAEPQTVHQAKKRDRNIQRWNPSCPKWRQCQHIHSQRCKHGQKHDEVRCEICLQTAKQGHWRCWPRQFFSQYERHPRQLAQRACTQRGCAQVHHEGFKKKEIHLRASTKSESSTVLSLHEEASNKRRMTRITRDCYARNSYVVIKRNDGNSQADHFDAVSLTLEISNAWWVQKKFRRSRITDTEVLKLNFKRKVTWKYHYDFFFFNDEPKKINDNSAQHWNWF